MSTGRTEAQWYWPLHNNTGLSYWTHQYGPSVLDTLVLAFSTGHFCTGLQYWTHQYGPSVLDTLVLAFSPR
eukprot:2552288-Rhodomonas_salina.2